MIFALAHTLQKRSFSIALKNRFEALDDDLQSVDDAWTEYKDIYITTAAETLGQRARLRKDWLSPSTWKCIGRKTEAKTEHFELPLRTSEGKQTADVSNERQGSVKESTSRQEESLGKSRGRDRKGSAPKQPEKALHQNLATKQVPQEAKYWNTDETG